MIFKDTTSQKRGIVDQVRFLTKSNDETFPIEDITRLANMALDRYWMIAQENNNSWKLDDTNYPDPPTQEIDLVAGQEKYDMPAGLIDIGVIKVKDQNGTYQIIEEYRENEGSQSRESLYEATGSPQLYEKKSDGIFLIPAPNANVTDGLKFEYTRIADYYVTTDTTKEAGIPQNHHAYIAFYIAHQYGLGNVLQNFQFIENEMAKIEGKIEYYWITRGSGRPVRMTPLKQNNR